MIDGIEVSQISSDEFSDIADQVLITYMADGTTADVATFNPEEWSAEEIVSIAIDRTEGEGYGIDWDVFLDEVVETVTELREALDSRRSQLRQRVK